MPTLKHIRESILTERRMLMPQVKVDKGSPYTRDMKYVELQTGKHIEELLMSGSLSEVAKLIDRDKSTVSKWIKRLNLRR